MNERVTKSSLYCCLLWIQIHSSFFHLTFVSPTLPSSHILNHPSPMLKGKFFSSLRHTKDEFVIFHIFLHCSRRFYSNLSLIVISSNFLSTSPDMNLTGLKRNWAFFDLCSSGIQGSRDEARDSDMKNVNFSLSVCPSVDVTAISHVQIKLSSIFIMIRIVRLFI